MYLQSVQFSAACARGGRRPYGASALASDRQPRPSSPSFEASVHLRMGPCFPCGGTVALWISSISTGVGLGSACVRMLVTLSPM